MVEAFSLSIQEAQRFVTQDDALDYLAKRGPNVQATRSQRIKVIKLILEKEFLPHIKEGEGFLEKAYFLGYMTNRLLQGHLGRIEETDRDYYGKKRLDMSGALLNSLFRQNFKTMTDILQKILKK